VAGAAVLVSVVLAIVVAVGASTPILFLGIPLPLVTPGSWWLSFIGYLLTPVLVLACYGWDAVGQRNGLRANRNFVLRPTWRRSLQWLTGIAIVVGAWHVLNLSVPLSEAWGFS
jgi:purine-cytosine permease-like protein